MSGEKTESLEDLLSDLFGETVTIEGSEQRELGAAELSLIEMGYTKRNRSPDGPTTLTHIRQTALVSHDAELDLPHFALSPTPKGIGGVLMSLVGDMGDLDFEDSPEFSNEYHLHAWSETPVRLLFTKAIRDHLGKRHGWSVMGRRNVLVIYYHNRVVDGEERTNFMDEALEILGLFQQAEETLDTMPQVRRETTGGDMAATAERMGGLAGSMLANQLRKLSVTQQELDQFASSPTPRTIPRGIKRQVVGNYLVFVPFGFLFIVAGLVAGSVFYLMSEGAQRWISIPFFLFFPMIGSGMVFFPLRHYWRKNRALRDGKVVSARVTDIERTNASVNQQRRYHVSVDFSDGGQQVTRVLNAYGPAVDLARQRKENGEPMRVIVDPADCEHLIGIDLLMMFDK